MPTIQPRNLFICAAALLGLTGAAAASSQDVQTGITAWQAGDYAGAVAAWRPLAQAGNADAQFNLAQAYRLGRGVAQNLGLAEQWFERAARQRHAQAGASLGLLLFQNGRAREAMPWIQAAAMRGDPRAQYVFGTALFNGDVLRRDLPRAFAMMSAAAAQGFPQAQSQLAEMERQLSPEDRDRGRALAAQMAAPGGTQMAAAEPPPVSATPRADNPPPRSSTGRITAPAHADPAPRIAAAEQARPQAPDTSRRRPDAGVSYAPPPEDGRPSPVTTPERRTAPATTRTAEAPRRTPAPAPAQTERTETPAAASGAWRVQLGAFSSADNARRQWSQVSRRVAALGKLQPSYPKAGALTRLRAGSFTSRADAERICSAVRAAGAACIPIR